MNELKNYKKKLQAPERGTYSSYLLSSQLLLHPRSGKDYSLTFKTPPGTGTTSLADVSTPLTRQHNHARPGGAN